MTPSELHFTANLVFMLTFGVLAAATFYLGTRIAQPRVPMQWGPQGKPSWYAPKAVSLWSTMALMLAMRLVFFSIEHTHPDARLAIWWLVIALAAGCGAAQFLYLLRVRKWMRQQTSS